MSDSRSSQLEVARDRIIAALAPNGVERVEYVGAFPVSDRFAVWLGAGSDKQATASRSRADVKAVIMDALRAARVDTLTALEVAIVLQSQEIVDRDYGGSWFYATR